MDSEAVNFDEIVDQILDHIVSCSDFYSLRCCHDPQSLNQTLYCDCGVEWRVRDDLCHNLHWINERLLMMIKDGRFTKENEGVRKILELYQKAKQNKEIKENITDKMNILYNIDV